jgi:hypothetical protein
MKLLVAIVMVLKSKIGNSKSSMSLSPELPLLLENTTSFINISLLLWREPSLVTKTNFYHLAQHHIYTYHKHNAFIFKERHSTCVLNLPLLSVFPLNLLSNFLLLHKMKLSPKTITAAEIVIPIISAL